MEYEEEESLSGMPEGNIFDKETMNQIIQAKKDRPNEFQSHWEADENNIDTWTSVSCFHILTFKVKLSFNFNFFSNKFETIQANSCSLTLNTAN